jgi:hypothetical protein
VLADPTAECSACGAPPDVAFGAGSACAECQAVFRPAYDNCLQCGAPKVIAMATTRPEATLGPRPDGEEGRPNAKVPSSPSHYLAGDGRLSKSAAGDVRRVREEAGLAQSAHENSNSETGTPAAISKGEGQMTFWRWLYRRIGQMLSFTAATALLLFSSTVYEPLSPVLGSAVLFGVALSLRHQMITRFYLK